MKPGPSRIADDKSRLAAPKQKRFGAKPVFIRGVFGPALLLPELIGEFGDLFVAR